VHDIVSWESELASKLRATGSGEPNAVCNWLQKMLPAPNSYS